MAAELPDWLTAGPAPKLPPSYETMELRLTQYDVFLPRILERVCAGYTLPRAIKELPVELDSGAFIRWLKKQPDKYQLYLEAKEVRTETWAGKIIEHATAEKDNGDILMEEVSRSKLIIDTYKFLMGADNRKVYGDTKTIDVSGTISITAALAQAQSRVTEYIEAEVVEVLNEPPRLLESGDED